MLAVAESMLEPESEEATANGISGAGIPEVTPTRPLHKSQSGTQNNAPRSSVESEARGRTGGGSKKLSGPEQDAVVAKIRSAAKRSASPEKALPFQDDDTPTTKSLRHKKEMEVRVVLCVRRTCVGRLWEALWVIYFPSNSPPLQDER